MRASQTQGSLSGRRLRRSGPPTSTSRALEHAPAIAADAEPPLSLATHQDQEPNGPRSRHSPHRRTQPPRRTGRLQGAPCVSCRTGIFAPAPAVSVCAACGARVLAGGYAASTGLRHARVPRRKGGLSGSAPTDASGHQSGSGRGRSLPVASRSRGSVSARDALDAMALASCAPTEAQKRSCGRRWADRSRRGMGCVAACGPEAVALSRATASTRWLVCGAGGSVAPGGGAAEFRIVGLEQHFPDSDGIAGRRPERRPR